MIAALFVLGILLTGLSNTLINVLDLSRNNAARVIAANLAAGALDELRLKPFDVLADLVDSDPDPTWTESVDGITFTLARDFEWSSNLADAGVCLGSVGAGESNIIVIRVEVTWVRPRNIRPVTAETAVSPPISADSSNSGTIAVQVRNHEVPPQPIQGVAVTLTGPLGGATSSPMLLTDSDGCAVFPNLARGDYEASLHYLNYVDNDQRSHPDVTQTIGTAPRVWAALEFRYALPGEVGVTPEGWATDSQLPLDNMPWYLANTRDSSPFEAATTDESLVVFPGTYDVAVAYCDDVEVSPQVGDSTVSVGPGENVDEIVTIGAFEVEWSQRVLDAAQEFDDLGLPRRELEILALPPQGDAAVTTCYDGVSPLKLGTIEEGALGRRYALPFGEGWRIELRTEGSFLVREPVDLLPSDLEQTLPPTVEFDYVPPEPDPDLEACGGLYAPSDSGIIQAEGGVTQVVEIDGWDYCLHTFTQVGGDEFVVSEPGDGLAYLVVGGGGSGGGSGNVGAAGGGGAGRVIYGVRSEAVEAGSYAVVVGAGGAAQTNNDRGNAGEDSSLAAPFAVAAGGGGGGRGGDNGDGRADGGPGGSGGGGGRAGDGGSAADGATGNLGNPGARGRQPNQELRAGGGGGGAQTPGTPAATDGSAGDGGAGLDLSVFELGTIAGGGGGGARAGNSAGDGASGGGDGGAGGAGGAAAPNTGSGGGGAGGPGSGGDQPGGAGGSGVIVLRYPLQAGAPQPLPGFVPTTCSASPMRVDAAGSTFTQVPEGCTRMTVEVWGAGGGGNRAGGGGGGYAITGSFPVFPGQRVDLAVGAGGSGDGGSSFVTYAGFTVAQATGGLRATGVSSPGLGGARTVGDAGFSGGRGAAADGNRGGGGGGSAFTDRDGGHAAGRNGGNGLGNGGNGGGPGSWNGVGGSSPGGGGGGAGQNASDGVGANGRVQIAWS